MNPFHSSMAKAVEGVAIRHNAVIIIGNSGENAARERELVLNLLHRPVDGMILVPASSDHRYLEPERRLGAQIVFLDRSGGNIEADAAVLDNCGGAKRAVDHLIRRGHRRIGFVGDSATIKTAGERLDGYKEALAEASIAYDPELGRAAAELLFSRMTGDARPPQRIVIPTRLVQRGSGEISA
jgi:LacI family transcriptional regulator